MWLNLVECWFSVLSRHRLERGAFSGTENLENAIRDYITETNAHPKPFIWTKSADAILASVGRFCTQNSNSDHQRRNAAITRSETLRNHPRRE